MTAPAPAPPRPRTGLPPGRSRRGARWLALLAALVAAGVAVGWAARPAGDGVPAPPAPVAPATGLAGDPAGAPWSPGRAYAQGAVVVHGGRRWVAAMPSAGWAPGAGAEVGPAQGFAQGVTGGAGGREVWVTSLADDGPGTLRAALRGGGPVWVRFAVDGVIRLSAPVRVPSDATVDGRGAAVTLAGRGLRLDGVSDVIVTGLSFRDGRGANTDGVLVQRGSRRVWLDHLDIAGFPDEAIDISQGSSLVTVSWVRVHDQDKGILIGSWGDNTSTESIAHVTVHHSWFDRTHQRNPRAVRHSRVHAYNNYVHGWTGQGMSIANRAQLASEANILEAGDRENGLVTGASGSGRAPDEGYARTDGDLLVRGARQDERAPDRVFDPRDAYSVEVAPADDALRAAVTTHAGVPGAVGQDARRTGPWRPLVDAGGGG